MLVFLSTQVDTEGVFVIPGLLWANLSCSVFPHWFIHESFNFRCLTWLPASAFGSPALKSKDWACHGLLQLGSCQQCKCKCTHSFTHKIKLVIFGSNMCMYVVTEICFLASVSSYLHSHKQCFMALKCLLIRGHRWFLIAFNCLVHGTGEKSCCILSPHIWRTDILISI